MQAMEEWLREAGAAILGPVPSVKQALGIIEDDVNGLDVAVLDVNLGNGETVYPVADRLYELGVPYLFTTGDVRIRDVAPYRTRPKLDKPVLEADLLRAIEMLLATSARHLP